MARRPTRPLMAGCMLYLAMLVVLFLLSGSFVLQIILCGSLVLLFGGLAWLVGCKRFSVPDFLPSRTFCIGAVISVVLAFVGVTSVMKDMHMLQTDEPVSAEASGVVERIYWAGDSGAAFLLDLDTINGKRVGGKIFVESTGSAYYANEGEEVTCQVVFGDEEQAAEYAENRLYAFPDGIYAYTTVASPITVHGTRFSFRVICGSISAWCRQQLYRYLPEDTASLCISILLGDKSVLSPQVKRDFRRVGVSHVLAVSGLHLSVMCSGLLGVLQSMRVIPKRRYVIALVLIVLYMGMTGFSPSVMRAGVMWMIACIAQLWHARSDALTSLFVSAACICVAAPYAVFDVGLMLSVSATLGLILLMKPLSIWMRSLQVLWTPYGSVFRSVLELIATTTAATIFTMPIMLAVYGELSLVAPLSNLLIHIPIAVLLYTAPIFLLLSLCVFIPPVNVLLGWISGILVGDAALIEDVTAALSRIPHVIIGVRYVFAAVLLVGFLAVFCYLYLRYRNILVAYSVYAAFLAALLICLQINAHLTRDEVALTYSVYRKNDIVTITTEGRGMLIDASDGSYTSAEQGWNQLAEQNITELDVLVLTHYHTRHASTLTRLAQNTVIRTLVLPEPLDDDEKQLCSVLSDIASNAGIMTRICRRGEEDIVFGRTRLSLFPSEYLTRSTQPLIGYRLTAGDDTVLYLGGAAFEAEDDTSYSGKRSFWLTDTELLMLGIHGPLYKQEVDFSRETPLRAIICANNEIGSLLTQAARSSAMGIWSISDTGSIRVVLDGGES